MGKRYTVYSARDINSKPLFKTNNKAEAKKVRSMYRFSMVLCDAFLFDSKENIWIP